MSHMVVVTSSGLNLREIPSTGGHAVDQLNQGDELSVIGERTSISGVRWLRVHVLRTGDQGWVVASHTKEKPEKPLPPPSHQHQPPLHRQPPKPDWDFPSSSWDIPPAPLPTKKKWEWVWVIGAVLIIVGVLLLFRH